jgi:hypothetical protein
MVLAQIGPLTTLLGVAATAIGAGVVIGSATAGLIRLTRRRSRGVINEAAAAGGAVGGGFGAMALVVDLLLRYAGLK